MTSEPEKPKWSTGVLWGILAVFLVLGSVGLAAIVYGFLGVWSGNPFALLVLAAGALGAFLSFLFTAGILYRVDQYRGVEHRRIDLFE